jgi:hypothetical protein
MFDVALVIENFDKKNFDELDEGAESGFFPRGGRLVHGGVCPCQKNSTIDFFSR